MIRSDDINEALYSSWCTDNGGREKASQEVERLISVLPDKRQLEFMKLENYNFIHFVINTMTNRVSWGAGLRWRPLRSRSTDRSGW